MEAILIGTFFVSSLISFFSRRFLLGFFIPPACFLLFVIAWAFWATGWKLEGIAEPLAYSVAMLITGGLPLSIISTLGAGLGAFLAARMKSDK